MLDEQGLLTPLAPPFSAPRRFTYLVYIYEC